jgi:hypothetical protein
MLRVFVLALGGVFVAAGAFLMLEGLIGPGLYALFAGAIFILGTLFERWRYRKYEPLPDAGWQATGEKFVDPSTGKDIEVFYDPQSGERRYVER